MLPCPDCSADCAMSAISPRTLLNRWKIVEIESSIGSTYCEPRQARLLRCRFVRGPFAGAGEFNGAFSHQGPFLSHARLPFCVKSLPAKLIRQRKKLALMKRIPSPERKRDASERRAKSSIAPVHSWASRPDWSCGEFSRSKITTFRAACFRGGACRPSNAL